MHEPDACTGLDISTDRVDIASVDCWQAQSSRISCTFFECRSGMSRTALFQLPFHCTRVPTQAGSRVSNTSRVCATASERCQMLFQRRSPPMPLLPTAVGGCSSKCWASPWLRRTRRWPMSISWILTISAPWKLPSFRGASGIPPKSPTVPSWSWSIVLLCGVTVRMKTSWDGLYESIISKAGHRPPLRVAVPSKQQP